MIEKDLRLSGVLRVHGCPVYRIATRRVPAVGPIQHAIRRIEIQIDWLRKVIVKNLDVAAALDRLTLRNLDIRPTDTTEARFVATPLRPIKLSVVSVHRNSDTPFPCIRPRA